MTTRNNLLKEIFKKILLFIFLSLTMGCVKKDHRISCNTLDKEFFIVSGHLINHKFFFPDYQSACRMACRLNIDDRGFSQKNGRYYFPKSTLKVWESDKISSFSDVCLLTDFQYCAISGFQNEQYFAFRNSYTPSQHCFFLNENTRAEQDLEDECVVLYAEAICSIEKDSVHIVRYITIEGPKKDFVKRMHHDYLSQVKTGKSVKLCGLRTNRLQKGYQTYSDIGNYPAIPIGRGKNEMEFWDKYSKEIKKILAE